MADGTAIFLGGNTIKNVAGYDAVKLLCGSLGAYGAILSATLKISAAAAHTREPEHYEKHTPLFEPDDYHRRVKNAFDPENLLNPWIYGIV